MAVMIGQNLNFDMPRAFQKFFEIDAIVAEACLGFSPCHAQALFKLLRTPSDGHAASATA